MFWVAIVFGQEPPAPTRAPLAPRGGFPRGGGFAPSAPPPVTPSESGSRGSALLRPLPSRPLPDKIGKSLTFEVLLAELYEPIDSPTVNDILALEKVGKLNFVNRLQLTSLEDQSAFVQFGALTARVTGRATTGLTVVPIYNDINLGTIAQVTGRVTDDGSIVAQVMVERSALAGGEEGPFDPSIATPPKGIDRLTMNSTVRLKPGEPQLIGGRQATLGRDSFRTYVMLTGYVGSEVASRKEPPRDRSP
jgi:hypothetical protein